MAVNELIYSRFLHVWYTTDSVNSTGKTSGNTPDAACHIQRFKILALRFLCSEHLDLNLISGLNQILL